MTYSELITAIRELIEEFPETATQDVSIYNPGEDEVYPLNSVFVSKQNECVHCIFSSGICSLDDNHLILEIRL